MNEEPVERYSSISIRPYRPDLMAAFTKMGDLTPEERRERRLRLIDEAEQEITLIRQEVGKLPESSLDKRIDDLLSFWRIRLKIGDGESAGSTREERLKYLEQLIKQHREDLNKMEFPDSAKPAEESPRNAPCLWLLLPAGIWCIVLALADFREIWIYDLSRWTLFGIGAYAGFRFWKDGARRLPIVLGVIAVIFNPFAPIRFGDAWNIVDALAGATFIGAHLWVAGWISKIWKNRNVIGTYALIGGVVCVFVVVSAGAYLDTKNGGPERRAAELKSKKEKADAAALEKRMKSIFGDNYEKQISRKIYGELGPPPANSLLIPGYEPVFQNSWKAIDSEDANGFEEA